jgi:hypothetical protein
VRETTGHPQLTPIVLAQLNGNVPPEIRTPDTDVDHDVKYPAAHRADKLALGEGVLKVQSAKNAIAGSGQVILDEWTRDAVIGVSIALIGLQKESPLVTE